jgi:hypothetical protein
MQGESRRDNVVNLLADQRSTLEWLPKVQAYLREHQPPTLIAWGPHDGYMPEAAARVGTLGVFLATLSLRPSSRVRKVRHTTKWKEVILRAWETNAPRLWGYRRAGNVPDPEGASQAPRTQYRNVQCATRRRVPMHGQLVSAEVASSKGNVRKECR